MAIKMQRARQHPLTIARLSLEQASRDIEFLCGLEVYEDLKNSLDYHVKQFRKCEEEMRHAK